MQWRITGQQQLVRAIKLCGELKDLAGGRKIHHYIANDELLRNDRFFPNLLVEMYGKCSSLEEARRVFANIREPNLFSMLTANAHNGRQAKKIFDTMPERDSFTWNFILTAHTQNSSLRESLSFFSLMPQRNSVSWSAILLAYADKGHIFKARELFNSMPEKNLPTWNAMLTAYVQNGEPTGAKKLFDEMPKRNQLTWNSILGARCEDPAVTRRLYERVPVRNLITFNSILRALGEYGADEEEVLGPGEDARIKLCFRAYARRGQLQEAEAAFSSMPEKDTVAHGGSLASNRFLHGMLEEANSLFQLTSERSIPMWNLLLAANAQRGHLAEADNGGMDCGIQGHAQFSGSAKLALELFQMMRLRGVEPDGVTFLGVLAACSHIGLLRSAREYFISLESYRVAPSMEHYSCMVDMLGRAGRVKEAEELIQSMPFQEHGLRSWGAVKLR